MVCAGFMVDGQVLEKIIPMENKLMTSQRDQEHAAPALIAHRRQHRMWDRASSRRMHACGALTQYRYLLDPHPRSKRKEAIDVHIQICVDATMCASARALGSSFSASTSAHMSKKVEFCFGTARDERCGSKVGAFL